MIKFERSGKSAPFLTFHGDTLNETSDPRAVDGALIPAAMRSATRIAGPCALALLAFCMASTPAQARTHAGTCAIVDAITPLAAVAVATAGESDADQVAAYRRALIGAHPGLYAQQVLDLKPGPAMDRNILASLAEARTARDRSALIMRLRSQIAATSRRFSRVFPDFRCNFTVYLTDSLGQFDGAGRVVDGRPALVLGVPQLERELTSVSLGVLLSHEFFHRYHFEAAGFSDDPGENQQIWRVLWVEGLATYISKVLTPGATTADALMLPRDLAQRAQPLMPRLASDLLAGMDRIDVGLFDEYFRGGPAAGRHGLPIRSGYYVGYIVVERLAERHSLVALAHLRGAALHDEIASSLRELATHGTIPRAPQS